MFRKSLRKSIGDFGEDSAAIYLIKLGFEIIDRNVRLKNGEIDIIAKKDNTLFFFEVRTIKNGLGKPLETIDNKKRKHVWNNAETYLTQCNWTGLSEIGYIGVDASVKPINIECVFE